MKISKLLSTSTGKIFIGNLVVQATSILQTIILARVLGPEGKGIFTEVILWPTIIAGFSILGLYTGIVKCVAKDAIYEKYNFVNTTFKVTGFVGTIGSIVSVLFAIALYRNNPMLCTLSIVFSIFVLANNIARGFVAIDHGRKDYTSYSITRSILNPIFFVFIFALYILDALSVASVVYSYLAANIIVALIRVVLGVRKSPKGKDDFSVKWLTKYSLRFAPSDFSEPIYAYYDKAIVALVLSSYDLGIYTVAYSAAAMINILPNVFSTKLFSDIAGGNSISTVQQSMRVNAILMFGCAVFLTVLFPFIVPFLLGEEFNTAIMPAIFLLLTCALQGQSMILERTFLAKGYPFVGIKAKVITICLFAILSVVSSLFDVASLYVIILICTLSQTVYLTYLYMMFRRLFNQKIEIIPTSSDFKSLLKIIK